MFTLNGFDLDDNVLEGHLNLDSEPYQAISRRINSFDAGDRDGRITVRAQNDATSITLVERLPAEHLRAFHVLLNSRTLVLSPVDESSLEAVVELGPMAVTNLDTDPRHGPMVDATFVLQFNGVYWRGVAETTTAAVVLGAASVDLEVFEGLSAPIRDAVVRVSGGITGVRVTDVASGSWFQYPNALPEGSYLRFDSDTGKAYTTTSDTWTGGTEVTGQILNGPGPYPLELAPFLADPADPTDRAVKLTVTSSVRTGSPAIQVRGKIAHLV